MEEPIPIVRGCILYLNYEGILIISIIYSVHCSIKRNFFFSIFRFIINDDKFPYLIFKRFWVSKSRLIRRWQWEASKWIENEMEIKGFSSFPFVLNPPSLPLPTPTQKRSLIGKLEIKWDVEWERGELNEIEFKFKFKSFKWKNKSIIKWSALS